LRLLFFKYGFTKNFECVTHNIDKNNNQLNRQIRKILNKINDYEAINDTAAVKKLNREKSRPKKPSKCPFQDQGTIRQCLLQLHGGPTVHQ